MEYHTHNTARAQHHYSELLELLEHGETENQKVHQEERV